MSSQCARTSETPTRQTLSDYAKEIEVLISEEQNRITRILCRIDESMAAVNETLRLINPFSPQK